MNDADRILDFRDELDRDARAHAAAPTMSTASDSSGSVGVAFDSDARVLSVVVRDGWLATHAPSELGPVIVDLVVQLAAERARQWGETVAEDETARVATPLPPQSESPGALLQSALVDAGDSLDVAAMLGRMMTMLEEVNAGMDSAMQIVTTRLSTSHVATSAGGHARATVDGSGAVTALQLDEPWLRAESPADITREINQAIAIAAAAGAAPTNPFVGTPLERYGALLDDPSALSRIFLGKD
ncbi:hypothetical protein [Leifsonia sp. Leaf264]|uniref:hypothetical protein n=1 Tax=Leifsonia sp. Leaf264 TaxID=1736314 RepID=UPI000A48B346|nr:hypothetical protein [Leifsonia sp. Leaf264]